jgi:hypothetical protein
MLKDWTPTQIAMLLGVVLCAVGVVLLARGA